MTVQTITNIDVYVVKTTLDTPFAFSQGWVHQRAATLVRITTDSGIEGWGEAFSQGLEPPDVQPDQRSWEKGICHVGDQRC